MNRRGFITSLVSGVFGYFFAKKIQPEPKLIRGRQAHFIIIDDPYTREDLRAEMQKYSEGLQRYLTLQGHTPIVSRGRWLDITGAKDVG